jgi:hypothetical protein
MGFLGEIERWAVALEALIEKRLEGLGKSLRRLERDLLRLLLKDVLPKMDLAADGKIRATARNLARLNLIDAVMREFAGDAARDLTKRFAEELLQVAGMNAEYYLLAGFDEAKVGRVVDDLRLVRAVVGIDDKGALVPGGYLDRLSKADEVRQAIRDYVVGSMAGGVLPSDLATGLQNLVEGGKEGGAVTRHWKAYAFDTYNQIREVQNLHMANELKLNYFVYVGGIIKTSRRFCIKKNGKVFSRAEADEWKNDPDLIDQATKGAYKPLLERGRNNCRHFIMWISDERAQELRPELKKRA